MLDNDMSGFFYRAGKVWKVEKLWEVTKDNEVKDYLIADFLKQDIYWNIGSFKDLAEEMKLVLRADYSYPIIIDERGRMVDGAHRVIHAYIDGVETIKGVTIKDEQFPEPDYDEYVAAVKAAMLSGAAGVG